MGEYNIDYHCTYTDLNEYNDLVEQFNKEFVEDLLYKNDILNIFQIKDYNDDVISCSLKNIYNKIGNNEIIRMCIKKILDLNPFFENDEFTAFMMFFAFENLHICHPCLCELLKTGNVSHENLTKLNKLFML